MAPYRSTTRAVCVMLSIFALFSLVPTYHYITHYAKTEDNAAENTLHVETPGHVENMERHRTSEPPTQLKTSPKPLFTMTNEQLEKFRAPKEAMTQHKEALACAGNVTGKQRTWRLRDCLETYITTPDWICPGRILRLGHETRDGGWGSCISQNGFTQPCVVFSFGINRNWLFDDDISKHHNCTVHAFDPSMNVSHQDRGEHIHFYDVGLSDTDTLRDEKHNWPMMTFKTMLAMLNLTNTRINMVKMDIESAELWVLSLMSRDGSLVNVQQLAFEVHLTKRPLQRYARMFEALEAAHFAHYFTRPNPISAQSQHNCCFEMYYINTDYIALFK